MALAGPPVIPTELQTYEYAPRIPPSFPTELTLLPNSSYKTAPKYQRYYTYAWTACTGLCVLAALPYLFRGVKSGYWRTGWHVGEYDATPERKEELMFHSDEGAVGDETRPAAPTPAPPRRYSRHSRILTVLHACIQSATLPSIPIPTITALPTLAVFVRGGGTQLADCCRKGYVGLTVGQMVIVAAYAVGVVLCSVQGAQLEYNANRPGFLALAQLTPVILLSTKNNPLGMLLGLGYEKLNWAHRASGRLLWLTVTLHAGLWVDQYRRNGQLGVLKSTENKYGIAAYVMLCLLAVFSVRPVRRRFYEVFWALHLTLRLGRYRFKDAFLLPLDETMTMIHIPDADYGWLPTQHVHVRLLSGTRIWEAHALTITNAPHSRHTSAAIMAQGTSGGGEVVVPVRGLTLYAKVNGDWTREVNRLAREGDLRLSSSLLENEPEEKQPLTCSTTASTSSAIPTTVKVIISGPYGGLKLDMSSYASVLLIAGGSGVTFMMGCIEECLVRKAEAVRRRRVRPRRGRAGDVEEEVVGQSRVDCVWVVRDMSTIESMSATLTYLHALATSTNAFQLNYHLYLTSPPAPLPPGPPSSLPATTKLSPYRPAISQLVRESLPPPTLPELEEGRGAKTCCSLGGLAVVACGPEGIVTESRNAVACLSIGERVRCGGVDFHGECYTL
ncbi:hypothetical protein QFC21_003334 [Naganishia friedmannii]|uniref:Uncharacterized protein n=1 Tax=Naganishia friedmannii TaxID=89922 RepID=A0ACC2VQV3_9TREE|nr:hypothetical protein QFC21_003334 [Naganishia friedmannii]